MDFLRRIPILPTLIVLAAVGVMIRLGFWQLDRLDQKQALLARYDAAQRLSSELPWPAVSAPDDRQASEAHYRRSRIDCRAVTGTSSIAGKNARGESGQAHVALCRLADGSRARVVIGWSNDVAVPVWRGGPVSGWIAPGPRLVADPPLAGLQANARPDPKDIPNNHLSYAVQWFLFALTALVIYGLAVWKRWRG